jgi:hypothetical protein
VSCESLPPLVLEDIECRGELDDLFRQNLRQSISPSNAFSSARLCSAVEPMP